MLKYFFPAIFARPNLPVVGRVPVNFLGMLGFGILGMVLSPFFLIGLGVQLLFTGGLASDSRFQLYVDSERNAANTESSVGGLEEKRQALVRELSYPYKVRLAEMERKQRQAESLYKRNNTSVSVVEVNIEALRRLAWVYLKLLVARNRLETAGNVSDESLRTQAEALEKEAATAASENAKKSKLETAGILRSRRANIAKKAQYLEEIDSDLQRVEAQIDLATENASLKGQSDAISATLDLSSRLMDASVFGEAQQAVSELDQLYHVSPAEPVADAARRVEPGRVRE